MDNPSDFKCLSVNIRGLNTSFKRRTICRWLHHQHCAFVLLQETYSSKKCKAERKNYNKKGRYIILDISLTDTRIVLVNIYAPNNANHQMPFFKEIQSQLLEFPEGKIIIGDDFNRTSAETDTKGGNSTY